MYLTVVAGLGVERGLPVLGGDTLCWEGTPCVGRGYPVLEGETLCWEGTLDEKVPYEL